jgi:transposase
MHFLCIVFSRYNCIHNKLKKYTREEHGLLNKSELARRFNCDSRTIDRYLKINSGELEPKKSSRVYESFIDDYKSIIIEKVDTYGATAMGVYKFIEKKGYKGKYSTIAEFVKKYKNVEIQKATVRFETTPGLQAQVDWKENLTMISKYGEIFKVNIFLMVLGYSRIKYVKLTTNREQKTLFKCMISAFGYFGGIPQKILFDNMKTVVDRSKSTFSSVEFNKIFKHFTNDAGFKPIACRPYRPQTKGKVESLARLTNRLAVYNGEFEDYDDLDRIVQDFMKEVNNEVSQAINETPLSRLNKELEYLKPLPPMNSLVSYVSCEKEYKVSKESMVNYKGRKYSVPTKYIGLNVNITESCDGNISIYYNEDFIVCHSLSKNKYNYKVGHMHEILKSDACKHLTDAKIDEFIKENMTMMDILLRE